jgi:cell division protein FtsB
MKCMLRLTCALTQSFLLQTTGEEDAAKTGLAQFQHPSEVAQLELDELMLEVTKRREEASGLHHEVMQLLKRREDLEHETEKLEYEDDIERERKAGLREVESVRGMH